jgi:hypothetical protein
MLRVKNCDLVINTSKLHHFKTRSQLTIISLTNKNEMTFFFQTLTNIRGVDPNFRNKIKITPNFMGINYNLVKKKKKWRIIQ